MIRRIWFGLDVGVEVDVGVSVGLGVIGDGDVSR